MKKIISVVLTVFLCLTATACGGKKINITPVTRGISFTAALTYYNECCEAAVTVSENGDTKMELTSPDSIAGLCLSFSGGSVTAEFGGLTYQCALSSMPEGVACQMLYQLLTDISGQDTAVTAENDTYYAAGKVGETEYRLFVGATGLPISALDLSGDFTVDFKNVTVIG